ncbi:Autophagy-related protein 13-like [Papilio machaon]|uniref:Autophagy-related protein 13 n=1 Tax=Papilio machaon TaxID=76193 RepID=A0A194QVK7_PAPMA|nr:Autophagy-related protein 13-like [Papilio machaon]
MATKNLDSQDHYKLYKFTKILALKVVQIVVQSRQGKKISHDYATPKGFEDGPPSSPSSLQWFNLSIPDEPGINTDTKRVLNGEVIEALAKVLCIEIILRTNDGDEMVLEVWTVKLLPGCDIGLTSVSTIYYRMSIMLKSTLSISRITPAYKLSRSQFKESYKISHRIYGGQPNLDVLGDTHKTIKVSELHTPIGTILIEVVYRTKMTMLPEDRGRYIEHTTVNSCGDILMKSDHFPTENQRRNHMEKKELDLTKPLTAGAFVDVQKIRELHESLYQQLPPEPPMNWLLAEKDKMEEKMKLLVISETAEENKTVDNTEIEEIQAHSSKAIEVPKTKESSKYTSLMDFPFAEGSPIAELANFYQECLQARSATEDWSEILADTSASSDSESLAKQLKMFEDAVPEFDSMVASMFSNSEQGSDHS